METAQRKTVLVVEDDHNVARFLDDFLTLEGFEVEHAPHGRAALEKLGNATYDVILCDMRMPELDGASLYRRLAGLRPDLLPRVIFLSGYHADETQAFLKGTGARSIGKPFQMDDLRRLIQEVLDSGLSSASPTP